MNKKEQLYAVNNQEDEDFPGYQFYPFGINTSANSNRKQNTGPAHNAVIRKMEKGSNVHNVKRAKTGK